MCVVRMHMAPALAFSVARVRASGQAAAAEVRDTQSQTWEVHVCAHTHACTCVLAWCMLRPCWTCLQVVVDFQTAHHIGTRLCTTRDTPEQCRGSGVRKTSAHIEGVKPTTQQEQVCPNALNALHISCATCRCALIGWSHCWLRPRTLRSPGCCRRSAGWATP